MSSIDLPPPEPNLAQPSTPAIAAGRPWGFWATVGFTLLLLIAWVFAQVVAAILYIAVTPGGRALLDRFKGSHPTISLSDDATLLALGGTLGGLLVPPVCVSCAWLRRGISVTDYLGLRNVPLGTWLRWLGICLAFCAASDTVTWLLGRPIVSKFLDDTSRSVAFVPLLWVAVVVGAPLSEEFIFRGFALPGLRYSFLRAAGAVAVTSLGWTALHSQYDLVDLSDLFLFGLVLGYARLRTGSLWIPIGMHALNNLWATLEVAIKVHFWP
jgi:membrane protease YdiL (CAAX protease family)